jgi:hypothetical protein
MSFKTIPQMVVLFLVALMTGCDVPVREQQLPDSRRTIHKLVVVSTDTADQIFWIIKAREIGGWQYDSSSNRIGDTVTLDTLKPGQATDTITLHSHTDYRYYARMAAVRDLPLWGGGFGSYYRSSDGPIRFLPGDQAILTAFLYEGGLENSDSLPFH